MDYVPFGSTGLTVSRLCLGCMTYGDPGWREWVLDERASRPFIYNPMGPKPNQKGLSRKHITEAIDVSLKRLGTDFVDLYIIHRFDPNTPVEETIEAMDDVIHAGKALYLGTSSMWAWQFMKMLGLQRANGFAPFVSMQNYVNLMYREEEREMLPLCRAEDIAVTPWSPLARGFLAGLATQAGREDGSGPTDSYMDTLGMGSEQDYAIAERVNTVGGSGASRRRLRWHGCSVCPA